MSEERIAAVRRHNEAWNRGSEIVAPNIAHIRGRQGIEVVARSTFVFTVEKGQITRLRMFQKQAEALQAVGRSER